MDEILVSVIIPVYNAEAYLEECFHSVCTQDHKNLQIIFINDGSTDSSGKLIDHYADADKRVTKITEDNHGLGYARNRGLENAAGKYVLFLDSDDMLNRGIISALVSRAEKDDLDMVIFDGKTYPANNQREKYHIIEPCHQYDYPDVYSGAELFAKMHQNEDLIGTAWINLYKTQWLRENQIVFPEGILHEDELWTFTCFRKAVRTGYLRQTGYFYRIRENSIMTKRPGIDNLRGLYLTIHNEILICFNNKIETKYESAFTEHITQLQQQTAALYANNKDTFSAQAKTPFDQMMLGDMENAEYQKIIDQLNENINDIYQSSSWKVGNTLINHFHKIKKLIKG